MGYSEDILKLTGGKGFGFASKGSDNNSDEETKNTKAKDNYVPVFIPFIEGESESQFVSVNDKDYLVRKGETVMVPPEVAEVLENSRIQQASASKRAKALQDKSAEIVQK